MAAASVEAATGLVDRSAVRRVVLRTVARVSAVVAVLVTAYVIAPFDEPSAGTLAVRLLVSLVLVVAVLVWQIRSVQRSSHPTARGVEIVCVSVPLVVLVFASTYRAAEIASATAFSEPLTGLDAVYLSVTILSTVGFGDIVPVSQAARALVTLQMLLDLAIFGLVVKVLVGAVRMRRQALGSGEPPPSP